MTRLRIFLTLGFTATVLLFAGREWSLWPDGKLHVYFFDVGQADGALIVSPSGKQIVIDGGRDGTLLSRLPTAMPFFDRSIDLLVMTHPQLDHMASFPELLRRYKVSAVLMTGVNYKLGKYDEFLTLLPRENAQVILADPNRDIDLGDGTKLDVLWPGPGLLGKNVGEVNNTAIVLKLIGRGKTVLFTGDIEAPAENAILKTGQDLRADILKVAHHGSKTSSGTGFLLAVDPELAVISCGKDNSYGHPHAVVTDRYKTLGIPLRVTAQEGTIELAW